VRELTEYELEKARIMKAVRVNIRLKHSLNADEELNAKLPELERRIEAAFNAGQVYELDVKSLLEDVE
jgi:hypothetical protein